MTTIDETLGIEVEKIDDHYMADATKLPGTPPCGMGKTETEAKYDLLAKLMFERAGNNSYGSLIDSLCVKSVLSMGKGDEIQ